MLKYKFCFQIRLAAKAMWVIYNALQRCAMHRNVRSRVRIPFGAMGANEFEAQNRTPLENSKGKHKSKVKSMNKAVSSRSARGAQRQGHDKGEAANTGVRQRY
jgi:hypothetical protein